MSELDNCIARVAHADDLQLVIKKYVPIRIAGDMAVEACNRSLLLAGTASALEPEQEASRAKQSIRQNIKEPRVGGLSRNQEEPQR
jgi:hypothetical protein